MTGSGHEPLFERIDINGLVLRNRFCRSAARETTDAVHDSVGKVEDGVADYFSIS